MINENMVLNTQCMHCKKHISVRPRVIGISSVNTENKKKRILEILCPSCQEHTLWMQEMTQDNHSLIYQKVLFPTYSIELEDLDCLPEYIQKDYVEASKIVSISPNASATLIRRCLQNVLRLKFPTNGKTLTLNDHISYVIKGEMLPSNLLGDMDIIRNFGNFGAHPIHEKDSFDIVEVNSDEAKDLLAVMSSILSQIYIEPLRYAKIKQNLNSKINATSKKVRGEDEI
jgi:hypothetical protein